MEKWICSNVNRIRDEIRLQQGAETQPLRGWGGGGQKMERDDSFILPYVNVPLFSFYLFCLGVYFFIGRAQKEKTHTTFKKKKREREKGEREAAHST